MQLSKTPIALHATYALTPEACNFLCIVSQKTYDILHDFPSLEYMPEIREYPIDALVIGTNIVQKFPEVGNRIAQQNPVERKKKRISDITCKAISLANDVLQQGLLPPTSLSLEGISWQCDIENIIALRLKTCDENIAAHHRFIVPLFQLYDVQQLYQRRYALENIHEQIDAVLHHLGAYEDNRWKVIPDSLDIIAVRDSTASIEFQSRENTDHSFIID